MELKDLDNNMVVELRDGTRLLVVCDGNVLLGNFEHYYAEYYSEDMKYIGCQKRGDNLDICKVWKINDRYGYTNFSSLLSGDFMERMSGEKDTRADLIFDRLGKKSKLQKQINDLKREINGLNMQLEDLRDHLKEM